MRVAVETIVAERSFGVILGARVDDCGHAWHGRRVRVKATAAVLIGRPVVGEAWEIEGEIQETRWGPQVEATRAVRVLPTGRLIQRYLAAHVPGVGPERARALWDRFGTDLGQVLDHPDSLDLIAETLAPDRPLLGPRLAAACAAAWREARSETLSMEWLSARGIEDVKVARTVLKLFGDAAVERLSDNPYCLVPLLSWSKVDATGLQLLAELGVAQPRRDRRRLVGAVDAAMKRLLTESATAITDADLRAALVKLGVARNTVDAAIEAGVANRAIIASPAGLWRAPGAALMENYLSERFHGMLDTPRLSDSLSRRLGASLMGLHPEQREAVLRVLESPVSALSGGAGTGKTTVTRAIAEAWEGIAGGEVVLCALAGKAALRLSQATRRQAMTIARLLHQLRQRSETERLIATGEVDETGSARLRNQLAHLARITPETLVIVDEASMVDLASLYNLVRRMPDGARLLLVGDEGQLPPVSFGLVFHRLVLDPGITARLTTVHRQTEAGGIPTVSRAIRERRIPVLKDYAGHGEGVSILRCATGEVPREAEAVWHDLGGLGSSTLIVTPTWDGEAGVRALNERLQRLNAAERPVLKGHLGQWFTPGDPVMWLRNDYRRGLYNRMIGIILHIDPESRSATVRFDGQDEPVELGSDDLIDLALAYAMTVHSSQGSQAPAVIVPLYQTRLLDPSLIYTAVTRAERQMVFVGDEGVIAEALRRPRAADTRLVGFEWTVEGRGQDKVMNPCPSGEDRG